MLGLDRSHPPAGQSFLPDDYIQRRTENRTNLIAISLFAIVTLGVIGAFLVTSRQWHDVKRHQEAINVRYAQAAKDIEQLKQLEERKDALLQKAELTTALIERVPRSILLAELINRMPQDATLLEMEVKSVRQQAPTAPAAADTKGKKGKDAAKTSRTKGGKDAKGGEAATEEKEAKPVIAPPRFATTLILVGVTTTHNSVAQYVAELQRCQLLTDVDLKFSEKAVIQDQELNRFRIEAKLRNEADARRITPLVAQRLNRDALEFPQNSSRGAAAKEAGEPQAGAEEDEGEIEPSVP